MRINPITPSAPPQDRKPHDYGRLDLDLARLHTRAMAIIELDTGMGIEVNGRLIDVIT